MPDLIRHPGFPVKTGIQSILMAPDFRQDNAWIPAFAGMTCAITYRAPYSMRQANSKISTNIQKNPLS
jgi:hypothetical protein